MTERKHFKQLVRARMARTGESYTTARRQLISAGDAPQPTNTWHHYPGSIATATAMRSLLSHAGVRAPHTRAPFSEAMVFGIGGGIGAGMFTFFYEKLDFSSFFVAGAHLWQDHVAWATAAAKRFGLKPVIKEASGAKPGEKSLREMMAGGRPVMVWLNGALLPHRSARAGGMMYHVATVHAIDDAAGTALVGDLADELIPVPLDDLARARAGIKAYKHRVLALDGPGKAPALAGLVRDGISACADALLKGRMKNFTLAGFETWAERLHGSKQKDAWDTLFPRGPKLVRGLTSITEYVEYYGTGGGLCRPTFAAFLAEAGSALKDKRLAALGERYAGLGEGWTALARAALPDTVPAFREARELLTRRTELQSAEPAAAREGLDACAVAMEKLSQDKDKPFPLSPAETGALLGDLQQRVRALYEAEVEAAGALAAWVG